MDRRLLLAVAMAAAACGSSQADFRFEETGTAFRLIRSAYSIDIHKEPLGFTVFRIRLLVAPVLDKGAVSRNVYLPKGLWKDFWNGDVYRGGRSLDAYPAPFEKLPVFVCIR